MHYHFSHKSGILFPPFHSFMVLSSLWLRMLHFFYQISPPYPLPCLSHPSQFSISIAILSGQVPFVSGQSNTYHPPGSLPTFLYPSSSLRRLHSFSIVKSHFLYNSMDTWFFPPLFQHRHLWCKCHGEEHCGGHGPNQNSGSNLCYESAHPSPWHAPAGKIENPFHFSTDLICGRKWFILLNLNLGGLKKTTFLAVCEAKREVYPSLAHCPVLKHSCIQEEHSCLCFYNTLLLYRRIVGPHLFRPGSVAGIFLMNEQNEPGFAYHWQEWNWRFPEKSKV